MSQSDERKVVTLAFRDERFQFRVTTQTEDVLRGFFLWTDQEKARLHEMTIQESDEGWYLDDMGYRLADTELFEKTGWSVIYRDGRKKAIQRFMDWNTGEAWFCSTPWVRIGNGYNQPPME